MKLARLSAFSMKFQMLLLCFMPYIKAAQEAKRIEEAARQKDKEAKKTRMGESEAVRMCKVFLGKQMFAPSRHFVTWQIIT